MKEGGRAELLKTGGWSVFPDRHNTIGFFFGKLILLLLLLNAPFNTIAVHPTKRIEYDLLVYRLPFTGANRCRPAGRHRAIVVWP